MKPYQTIVYEEKDRIGFLNLNRPDIRNAFNDLMIAEITDCINYSQHSEIVALVLRGNGKTFCAGADLNWMKQTITYSEEKNYQDNLNLAHCFQAIYNCRKPTLALVHGAAMGGANGLLAATDMAYCLNDTKFAFSEVKIGIVPATIGPYILKRIGEFNAKELMLTGKSMNGKDAERIGLVNKSFDTASEMNTYFEDLIQHLKNNGPEAVIHCKELIDRITNQLQPEAVIPYTAKLIAQVRASAEGQEGMNAFLEKRKPKWRL